MSLGTSFIKLAQVLATRSDFFTEDYLKELKTLHDQIPPMSQENYEKVFSEAFSSTKKFKSFSQKPIASASIGQVHIAYLHDNTKVAVKLRRYGVEKQVKADIKILSFFTMLFKPLFTFYTKNSIDAVISEFSKMILQEVNFKEELQNLKKFSTLYEDNNIIFPKPYEDYCSKIALVMSYEEGFRFDDKENILAHNIDFQKIIAELVDFYTLQMLIKGYFHADPHPGNILITKDSRIIFLDFGMVKSVQDNTRVAIIELIKAANEQNYEEYISANKRLGTIGYEASVEELANFTNEMFTIFSNDNLSSESMQKLAFEVLETTRNFPFKLPSDAIYILRVSAIIEGLGTTYIGNFNGIKDILPILQNNIPKALGLHKNTKEILQDIQDIPLFLNTFKQFVSKGNNESLKVEINNSQLEFLIKEQKGYLKSIFKYFIIILLSVFLVLYDNSLKDIALGIFGFAAFKILYK